MEELLKKAIYASIEAGKAILNIYSQDFSVETKSDNSPLTQADKNAHLVIKDALKDLGLPILSEEGKLLSFEERKNWETFWLIDPLDGTKEFIKKNGEFTVNIAMIQKGVPVLGVVYVPVTGMLYYGTEKEGSFQVKLPQNATASEIDSQLNHSEKLPAANNTVPYTVVASRSHNTPETDAFIDDRKKIYGDVEIISAGSSLKLCLVAEGKAQVYPRLAPTMEWDTAAGHAVAKFSGCRVYDYKTNEDLVYNKENLLNPWFVVERN
ncbi:MAG: 3'(2'),5'-bisphosphate nucleotidase CysQ [Bacteroidetes bacterium]|nr:3'(2'),5'-bisphosphate nucleotidase CysQ [Bacteroidota bacterium]